MKTVQVSFKQGYGKTGYALQEYSYLCNLEQEIKPGMLAVVDSPSEGLVLVVVRSVFDVVLVKATKHIVAVVDTTEYTAILKKEARRKELKKVLDAAVSKRNENQAYDWLLSTADATDELKQLINEFKSI